MRNLTIFGNHPNGGVRLQHIPSSMEFRSKSGGGIRFCSFVGCAIHPDGREAAFSAGGTRQTVPTTFYRGLESCAPGRGLSGQRAVHELASASRYRRVSSAVERTRKVGQDLPVLGYGRPARAALPSPSGRSAYGAYWGEVCGLSSGLPGRPEV